MGNAGGDQFASMAKAVAIELLGEPNKALSSKDELRFGSKGSLSVDLKKGTWFEHGADVGGGVLALIERETGRKGGEAIDWLREHGFHVEDRGSSNGRSSSSSRRESNRDYRPDADDDNRRGGDDEPKFYEVKTWDYVDELGKLLFQVVRMENGTVGDDGKPTKTYRQRKPDRSKPDGWDWSTKGIRQVPYRLPDLIEALGQGNIIFVVEGEKAADRLLDLGIPATTNARGAGKWVPELNEFFKGARVVVLADDDPQAINKKTNEPRFHEDGRPIFVGLDHANDVAKGLHPIARDVRVVQLTDRKKKEDVVDWLDQGGQIEDLYEIARKAPKWEPEPYRSKFHAVTWADLDAPGPEHEWIVKGVVTRAETSMVAGPSKSGKSFLVVDLGMAVARGVDWMGRRTLKGGVIYQAGEGARGIKKRLRAYRNKHGLTTQDDVPFVLLPSRLDLYNSADHTDDFIEEVNHWKSTFDVPLELIVIDTWSTATPGANENDGKDVSVVLERCNRIKDATGAAVVIVHHMNADGAKVRGHTSILANLENVLIVRIADGLSDADSRPIRTATVDKNKDGEGGQEFRFVLAQQIIGKDDEGDPITSCVVLKPNGDASDQAPPERASITDAEAMLLRAIEKAVSENGTKPPAGTGLPQSLRVVEWKQAMRAYDSIAFDGDEVENETQEERDKRLTARRQALKRSGERLMRKGVIARENPWVWLTGKPIKGYRRPQEQSQEIEPEEEKAPSFASTETGDAFPEMWGEE